MSTSTIGLFAGLLIAIAAAAGGFPGFLLALVLGAVGFVVGRFLSDGTTSKALDDLLSRRNRG
ncbi:hypothetical protein HPO96_08360 [Kribbella sandramycini]|uniref:Putative membrane protein n=1 Tax=Kribbella sandramycini TaxID=60450 RepID=A0A7Y4KX62_9ACTN|nr:hypothetical protein [Kribbella sandramycini]MBB6569922.1 putative membrane protein [Kribbella sandramycini]NOL40254.1 hypothetical protein [Kribbella sandramycini]